LAELITISVNGCPVSIPQGTAVAVAIAKAGESQFRSSVSGKPRGPLCGMGGCCECRVTIDGQPHQRSCITLCLEGMEVRTDG
jgi:predicted molibdopterin-dependent oxidoreductase YjgC